MPDLSFIKNLVFNLLSANNFHASCPEE